ncbi:MAG: RNA pseudouridine synthase [Opitutus sp.]|nr:RNA pseudouridine synthase [Opitutus sp.]
MPSLPKVVFEDEALIAFDKPSGLLIAPDRWDKTRANLMGLVHEKFGHSVANVHRIDADTSGVVLCTKTKPALDFVSGQFQSKTVEKVYHAVVVSAGPCAAPWAGGAKSIASPEGTLPYTFRVDLVLKEDDANPGRMCVVRKHGKGSVTDCRVLERFGAFTLLECRPQTGRTHQIRVHLAASGWPILNDPFYGNATRLLLSDFKRGYKGREDEKPLLARLALHASALTINHPLTRERVTITAPLPHDFEVALKYLRKFAAGAKRR